MLDISQFKLFTWLPTIFELVARQLHSVRAVRALVSKNTPQGQAHFAATCLHVFDSCRTRSAHVQGLNDSGVWRGLADVANCNKASACGFFFDRIAQDLPHMCDFFMCLPTSNAYTWVAGATVWRV